jgi:hypothetical protein
MIISLIPTVWRVISEGWVCSSKSSSITF